MNQPKFQYQRVKDLILSGIARGKWPAGSMVPSENELAQKLTISRMTANRAIKELVAEGVLDRTQGKGTFVAAPQPLKSVLKIGAIDQEILSQGNEYSNRLVSLNETKAKREIAEWMKVRVGSRVFTSTMVHYENEVPMQLEQRWVNPTIAPKFLHQDFTQTTPHHYLSSVAPLTKGEHTIEACLLGSRNRQTLEMESNDPCLIIHRRTWVGDIVASCAKLMHPGNRYCLSTEQN